MDDRDLCYRSLHEVRAMLDSGAVSSLELTEACLARIAAYDSTIHAFLTVTEDVAREQARAADARRASGQVLSPLDGIPMSLKDVMLTEGIRTTAGSQMLADFVPPYNGTVVDKL